VSSDLCDKLPDLGAPFHVLKAKSIVLAIWLGPNNQCIWIVHPGITKTQEFESQVEREKGSGQPKKKEGAFKKEETRTGLSLVNIVCSDRDL
jgi:hypothetical protein